MSRRRCARTDWPGRTNKLSKTLIKLTKGAATETAPKSSSSAATARRKGDCASMWTPNTLVRLARVSMVKFCGQVKCNMQQVTIIG
jgi:hypothetical protein